ncbi:MAG: acyltransferase family protein, partial [Planctomycetota bacterium]|nr:acyltransferase family protein [Planctomycetota bacterium]
YELLLLCVAAVVMCGVWAVLPDSVQRVLRSLPHGLLMGRWRWLRVPVLAAATVVPLMWSATPGVETSVLLLPPLHVLGLYAVCFFGGWALFVTPDALDALRRGAWLRLAAGLFVLLVTVACSIPWYAEHAENPGVGAAAGGWFMAAQVSCALAIWLITLGGIGVTERLFTRPIGWVRALVDASFWIYLVHLPISLAVVILMRDWGAPPLIKMTAAIVACFAVCLLTYWGARAVIGVSVRRSAIA